MHSHGSVGSVPQRHPTATDPSSLPTPSNFLIYRNFSETIVHRDPLTIADTEFSDDIFLRIVHPYDTDAFEFSLSKHHLTYFYSLLVTNLKNGFPLGEMPPLTDTVIFKNHPSTILFPDTVDKYLTDELLAGRMSGPFSLQHVENVLRGPIFCSPLLVSIQIQQPGTPDKLRVCRHLSKGDKNTPSTNSHIHKEDFPTRFDTASKVADIVRSLLLARHFPIFFHRPHLMGLATSPLLSLKATYCGSTIFMSPHLVALLFSRAHILWLYNPHGFTYCGSTIYNLHGLTFVALLSLGLTCCVLYLHLSSVTAHLAIHFYGFTLVT